MRIDFLILFRSHAYALVKAKDFSIRNPSCRTCDITIIRFDKWNEGNLEFLSLIQ